MPEMSPKTAARGLERESWIDTIRAVACLMVVLLHAAAYYVTYTDVNSSDWSWANAINSATRSCVPLFFMITGYLFLGQKYPQMRHILRVVTSIIVYSCFAVAVIWFFSGNLPVKQILAAPYRPVFHHLWYLYAVLGIYVMASIFALRVPTSWLSFVALLFLMFVLNDAGLTPVGSKIALDGNSVIYLLLAASGAVLGNLLPSIEEMRRALISRAALVLFCVCTASIALLTHQITGAAGSFVNTYYVYTHPLVIGAAMSAFTWLHLVSPPKFLAGFIKNISQNSLAIYGVHALVLEVVRRIANRFEAPAYLEIAIVFMSVLLVSCLIARLLRKVDRHGYFT